MESWEGVKLLNIHFKDHEDHEGQGPDPDMRDQYTLLQQLGEVMVRARSLGRCGKVHGRATDWLDDCSCLAHLSDSTQA